MSSTPSVVIVGRPNVGKSTLFNAITGQRRSIVGDEPGITRDRIYGEASYRGKPFELIDTGGIIPNDEEMIPSQILKQARFALDEASQIIFLIDGRTEITGTDRDLAKILRKLGKPVTLVVNKIDSQKRENLTHEFHALGFKDVMPVSAEHRLGIDELLSHITESFPVAESDHKARSVGKTTSDRKSRTDHKSKKPTSSKTLHEHEAALEALSHESGELGEDIEGEIGEAGDALASGPAQTSAIRTPTIKVAIIGRPNVGKSTLLNALTGTERAIVSPIAGTTRDAVDETVPHDGIDYVFVDTAGIRRKGKTKLMAEKLSVVMARRHLRMSNVAVIVLDASEGVLALDATIAGYAHEEGRAVILCVNKWDIAKDHDKRKFLEQIQDNLKFLDYAPIVFVSANRRAGTAALFPLVKKVYESASRRITTGELNRFVETLKWEYDMKIYYITQVSVRPPAFMVFTDRAGKLHFSAERYLMNRLRERFDLEGTPITIKTRRR